MNEGPETPGRSAGEEMVSFLDLAIVVLRERRLVAAFIVATPLLLGIAAILAPRNWTAEASFMPQAGTEAASARLSSLAGQFGFDVGGAEAGQSPQFYAELVRSREVLQPIASDTFTVADTTGLFADGILVGSIAELLELKEDARPEVRRVAAIRWLRETALSVSTSQETGIVSVSVTSPWPSLSGEIAGRIVDLVNAFNLETRQSQAAEERRFIEGRLEDARAELRTAENALEQFLRNNRLYRDSPELVFEHDRLQRQVTMRQQVFTSLMESYEQARITEVRNTPVITVLEPAEEPVLPDPRRLFLRLVAGLLLGGVLGLSVAFVRDYGKRSREGGGEMAEFSALWGEAKKDLRRVVWPFGRS